MKNFENKIAVVTGGGHGMGRELVRQLAAEGCHVATCDLNEAAMAETRDLARADGLDARITTHECDVSDEEALLAFRDQVVERHDTDHIHLLFNNAGLSGGGSLFTASRAAWDRCFAVCWGGVYLGTRTFLPLLVAADEGHIINTSSVNGFWASLGPERPHTAYSAAKFAVKGFTEALITDLRMNAPHVQASVVMPGHIGTSIVANSAKYGADEIPEDMAPMMEMAAELFRTEAPMSAADAATVILDGVRAEQWRILVGDDAHGLDAAVRANPEQAYDGSGFLEAFREAGGKSPLRNSPTTPII
ncbi:MAG: SDR family oxidoreductase [Acidimicrobiia bacterium]|nr:SDR family oxidoreductase [Acidimicrobiia bacterium]MDH5237869.1 SDR family oxidoreductase [Acidimicrobiia bacterium]